MAVGVPEHQYFGRILFDYKVIKQYIYLFIYIYITVLDNKVTYITVFHDFRIHIYLSM